MKVRGFWSDPDGWSLADVVTVLVLPVWMYVAIKFALAKDLSGNQVDYFLVLSYPLLIAVGGKAISNLPLPWPRRSGFTVAQQGYYQQPYYYQEQQDPMMTQTPEVAPEATAPGGAPEKPTI